MNLFDRANSVLQRVLGDAVGVSVRYRKAGNDHILTGWLGRTLFNTLTQTGNRIEWGELDLLLPAQNFTPAAGDRVAITLTRGDVAYEILCEVKAPGSDPAWRWSDPQRTQWRIHLKRVDQ